MSLIPESQIQVSEDAASVIRKKSVSSVESVVHHFRTKRAMSTTTTTPAAAPAQSATQSLTSAVRPGTNH